MLPIYKVQSLNQNVFNSIVSLEKIPGQRLSILRFGEMCYIIAEGFVRAAIQTHHIDQNIQLTRLTRDSISAIHD